MAVSPGTSIGPYRIESPLGAGGMGEVYRAVDTRIGRTVAIKVLPSDILADPERKHRFLQEAKSASALNHPNIVTIYEFESAEGSECLVMEFVPGKTLESVIPRQGMRPPEALRLAVQIADALAAAHSAGIVHRDVKPGNIMVTPNGNVKLLDFGLAKLTHPERSALGDATQTVTAGRAIAGTVSYMSPEQAEAKPLDARTDIFSFGCVLYEMLTGRRAFPGESAISTLSAILRSEPPAAGDIVPGIPRDLERVLKRCLRKDPNRRFQTAQDLKVALRELLDESQSGTVVERGGKRARAHRAWWIAAPAIALSLVAVWAIWARRESPLPPPREVPFTAYEGYEFYPDFSPDGNQVVFVWYRDTDDDYDIYVRVIGAGEPVALTSTPDHESSPTWSPDGKWIAFSRMSSKDQTALMAMAAVGGSERRIATLTAPFGRQQVRWSPDGKWLVASEAAAVNVLGLVLVNFETGEKRRLTTPPAGMSDIHAAFSPDGNRLAFARQTGAGSSGDILLLDVDDSYRPAGQPRPLTSDGQQNFGPEWTSDGRAVLFTSLRQGRPMLWRAPVSGGPPSRVESASIDASQPAVNGNRLAYTKRIEDSNIWRMSTAGDAPAERFFGSTLMDVAPHYSPDGTKLAYCSDQDGTLNIWVAAADGSRPARITNFNQGHSCTPRWSRDGTRLVFDSNAETGQFEIYVSNVDGGKPRRLTEHPGEDAAPAYSRDDKWIYFSSNRSGTPELWKMPSEGGQAVQVTTEGARFGLESPDGQMLWYMKTNDGALWRRPVTGGSEQQVLSDVFFRNFLVTAAGIYFMQREARGASFHLFDPATNRTRRLGVTSKSASTGLSVSADGRWLVYAQYDQRGSDITLVENFR